MELALDNLKPFLPGLEAVLDDDEVSELMINGPDQVFVERRGLVEQWSAPELDEEVIWRAAIQIARPLGKDPQKEPIIDARLEDGSRVAICSPPAAPYAAITIRRFGGRTFTIEELQELGSLPPPVVEQAKAVLRNDGNPPDRQRHRLGQDDAAERAGDAAAGSKAVSCLSRTRWSCRSGSPTACGSRRGD